MNFWKWLSGTDEDWIRQCENTERGKWLTPQEILGVQLGLDNEIAIKLMETRKAEGYLPYWWKI